MNRFEKINELPEDLKQHFQDVNNLVIETICKRLNKLNAVDVEKLKNAIDYAMLDIKQLEKEIARVNKKTLEEIDVFIDEIANKNIDFANVYYKAKGLKTIEDYTKHKAISKLVESIKKITKEEYRNISKSLGFKTNGINKTIRQQYINIVDKGIIALNTGAIDYYTALRNSVKEMAKTGVKYVEFDTGYNRRLDSQISMNLQEGARQLTMEIQDITAKEYGADGYEITAHMLCAPDHQHIQGKQFSKKEYEEMNSNLARQIGTLNCKHIAIPIVLGVSEPTYSKKQLQNMIDNSNKVQEYDDKSYTKYDATQEQRKLELQLRRNKEVLNAYKLVGDKIGVANVSKKIKVIEKRYKDFSQAMGLTLYWENTRIN